MAALHGAARGWLTRADLVGLLWSFPPAIRFLTARHAHVSSSPRVVCTPRVCPIAEQKGGSQRGPQVFTKVAAVPDDKVAANTSKRCTCLFRSAGALAPRRAKPACSASTALTAWAGSMNAQQAVASVCRLLHQYGIVSVSPEVFRRAKLGLPEAVRSRVHLAEPHNSLLTGPRCSSASRCGSRFTTQYL